MISNIDDLEFKNVFKAILPLFMHEHSKMIKLIIPYLIYFTIRFTEDDEATMQIWQYLNSFVSHELKSNYGLKTHENVDILIQIYNFIRTCLSQDRDVIKYFFTQQSSKTVFNEKIFDIKITKNEGTSRDKNAAKNVLINQLNICQSVKTTYATLIKLRAFIDDLDLFELGKAARFIKDYRQGITLIETHIKRKRKEESFEDFETITTPDEMEHLVYCYKKVYPEDFATSELIFDADIEAGRKSLTSNKFKRPSYSKKKEDEIKHKDEDISISLQTFYEEITSKLKYDNFINIFLEEANEDVSSFNLAKLSLAFKWNLLSINANQIKIDFMQGDSFHVVSNLALLIACKINIWIAENKLDELNSVNEWAMSILKRLKILLSECYIKSIGEIWHHLAILIHCVEDITLILETLQEINFIPDLNIQDESNSLESAIHEHLKNSIESLFLVLFEKVSKYPGTEATYKNLLYINEIKMIMMFSLKQKEEFVYFLIQKAMLQSEFTKDYFKNLRLFATVKLYKNYSPCYEIEDANRKFRISRLKEAWTSLQDNLEIIKTKAENYPYEKFKHLYSFKETDIYREARLMILKIKWQTSFFINRYDSDFEEYMKDFNIDINVDPDFSYIYAMYLNKNCTAITSE